VVDTRILCCLPVPLHTGDPFDGVDSGYGWGCDYPWVTRGGPYQCLDYLSLAELSANFTAVH